MPLPPKPTQPVPMPPPPPSPPPVPQRPLATPPGQTPEAALADGFAHALQRWALAQGAPEAAARAAHAAGRALSLATSGGHACLALDDLAQLGPEPHDPGVQPTLAAGAAGSAEAASAASAASVDLSAGDTDEPPAPPVARHTHLPAWRAALLASGVVGPAHQPGSHPMVLDNCDRLYLHRYFDLEQRLARRLARCLAPLPAPAADALAQSAALLTSLFAAQTTPLPGDRDGNGNGNGVEPPIDWQQIAAALALRGRLTVISGGPGTGKTTTVANLLACLLAQAPDARIVLAAPTGKAAARLAEALRGRAAHLGVDLQARLPTESFTLHRLLGVRPAGSTGAASFGDDGGDGVFIHHAGNPLALDVLVVDEASMLDLALATRLLEAVPDSARIILLGDKDQLAAVESGAVFAELSADPSLSAACRTQLGALCGVAPARIQPAAPAQASVLQDCVVWFNRNFRFAADSGIGRLAADTVAGRSDAALAWLRQGDDPSVRWLDDSGATPQPATMAQITAGFAPYLAALRQGLSSAGAVGRISDAFGHFRVLCAVHDGPRGVAAINQAISDQFQQALQPAPPGVTAAHRSPWYAGRPVMVLRNDPGLRLFNGDIGITLPAADGLADGQADGSVTAAAGTPLMVYFPAAGGGFRAVAPVRLPAHQTAFAMTVHKSQGSEFNQVMVLLPARPSRVLTRELLYTAVTRARDQVQLVAGPAVLAAAIAASTRRSSGLLARLAEAMAAPATPPACHETAP